MSRSETFLIRIVRDDEGRVTRVELEASDPEDRRRSLRVNGALASRVAGPIHDLLRGGGITAKAWTGSRPIEPKSYLGAQTELLLLAVKPLRRGDRVDQVVDGVASMSREEAAYWHAKATQPGGLRALRIMLTRGGAR